MTMTDEAAQAETTAEPAPKWRALPPGEWAIVELFGHTTLVGRISEVERFGAKMLALEPLFKGELLPVIFHGGAAIYRLTPCSAQVAWDKQPQQEYQLPPSVRCIVPPALLPAPSTIDHEDADERDNVIDFDPDC
jgi:hypothetical protein